MEAVNPQEAGRGVVYGNAKVGSRVEDNIDSGNKCFRRFEPRF